MLLYNVITEGYEGEDFARDYARGIDWSVEECSEQEKPLHSKYLDTVNGIDIYYNYGADYYFFADAAQ